MRQALRRSFEYQSRFLDSRDDLDRMAQRLLERGVLALPAGDVGSVLELSPPAVLGEAQERWAVDAVVEAVAATVTDGGAEAETGGPA